jgi:hypothetical protein
MIPACLLAISLFFLVFSHPTSQKGPFQAQIDKERPEPGWEFTRLREGTPTKFRLYDDWGLSPCRSAKRTK